MLFVIVPNTKANLFGPINYISFSTRDKNVFEYWGTRTYKITEKYFDDIKGLIIVGEKIESLRIKDFGPGSVKISKGTGKDRESITSHALSNNDFRGKYYFCKIDGCFEMTYSEEFIVRLKNLYKTRPAIIAE